MQLRLVARCLFSSLRRGAQNKARFPHRLVVFEGYMDLKVDNIIAQIYKDSPNQSFHIFLGF